MSAFKPLLLATALVTSLSGCVFAIGDRSDFHDSGNDHEQTEARNRSAIATLALGSPIADVQTRLGTPDFAEAVRGKSGEYRVLRYRTQRMHSDGDTTKDETTPLIFLDGKLHGIGDAAYVKAMSE